MKNAIGLMALLLLAFSCQKPEPEMLELSCTPVEYTFGEMRDALVGRWLVDQVVINGEIQVPENREIWEFSDTVNIVYTSMDSSTMVISMQQIVYKNGEVDTTLMDFKMELIDSLNYMDISPAGFVAAVGSVRYRLSICEDEFMYGGSTRHHKYRDIITGCHLQRIP